MNQTSDSNDRLPFPHFVRIGSWKLTNRGSLVVDVLVFMAIVAIAVVANLWA